MRFSKWGLATLAFAVTVSAQYPAMTLPPSGNNQKASVVQYIGPVRISIDYSSPSVHGPAGKDRRGHIWGELVPYGLSNLGFGNGKPDPWRAGANENTVFETSNAVQIEGKALPAGRYGLHMIPQKDEWTIIFSKNSGAWGSFFYEESEDALRVNVKPHKHDYREYLTYEFLDRKPESATAELQWEDLAVGWNIKVDRIDDIYISRLRHDLTNQPSFDFHAFSIAAQYTVQSKQNLDQGLKWAEAAVSMPGIGVANFNTLSTKSQVLSAMGRNDEAKSTMQTALRLPGTTPVEIHQYARQLQAANKMPEAIEVFKFNAEKNGDAWPVHVGMARVYVASGDTQKALEQARIALKQAPDDLNRNNLQAMIDALASGKPVTQ
jgi:tetratricopeptide (TPR) repeat protein